MGEPARKINFSNVLKMMIQEVVLQSKPLDKSLENYFRSMPHINFREKEEVVSVVTLVIRYWITIHEVYKRMFPFGNIDFKEIFHILQVLERIMFGKFSGRGHYENGVLNAYQSLAENKAVFRSFPEWLFNVFQNELGNDNEMLLSSLNENPQTTLRINILKTDTKTLLSKLKQSGKAVSEIDGYPHAILINRYFEIFRSSEFHEGLFEMQDAGSQRIAPFLEAEPGMRVIDACAGNGGKTLHLSALMQNKGKIIAMDIFQHKLDVLKKRMKRSGAFNVETRTIDSSKIIKRLEGSAERLLLDVPCSGTGVLKRNPDIKYHLSAEKLLTINRMQQDILERYSTMLTNKGIMVYSTCSILPSENELQVRRFLEKKQGQFELLEEQNISPLEGYDGFYMARLKKV